jgi:hypothetical protein
MAFITKCTRCKKEAGVAFDFGSGQKVTVCSCGNTAPVSGLSFDPQPEFLFKYRPHDCYSESWILNEELFFASPAMFNDPFDSKIMYIPNLAFSIWSLRKKVPLATKFYSQKQNAGNMKTNGESVLRGSPREPKNRHTQFWKESSLAVT